MTKDKTPFSRLWHLLSRTQTDDTAAPPTEEPREDTAPPADQPTDDTDPNQTPTAQSTSGPNQTIPGYSPPNPTDRGQRATHTDPPAYYRLTFPKDATGIPDAPGVEFFCSALEDAPDSSQTWLTACRGDKRESLIMYTSLTPAAIATSMSGLREENITTLGQSSQQPFGRSRPLEKYTFDSDPTDVRSYTFSMAIDGPSTDNPCPSPGTLTSLTDLCPHPAIAGVRVMPQRDGTVDLDLRTRIYFPADMDPHLDEQTEKLFKLLEHSYSSTFIWKRIQDSPRPFTVDRDDLTSLLTGSSQCPLATVHAVTTDDGAGSYLSQTGHRALFPLGHPYRTDDRLADSQLHVSSSSRPLTVTRLTSATERDRLTGDVPVAMPHLRAVSHAAVRRQPLFAFDAHGHSQTQFAEYQHFCTPGGSLDETLLDETRADDQLRVRYLDVETTLASQLGNRSRLEYDPKLEGWLKDCWDRNELFLFDFSESTTPQMDASSILTALKKTGESLQENRLFDRGTVAIDDPTLLLTDTVLEDLATATAFQDRASILLNIRHPVGISSTTTGGIDPMPTNQQATSVAEFIDAATDFLVVENTQEMHDLLDQDGISPTIEQAVTTQTTRHPESDWSFVQPSSEVYGVAAGSLDYDPPEPPRPYVRPDRYSAIELADESVTVADCLGDQQFIDGRAGAPDWHNYAGLGTPSASQSDTAGSTPSTPDGPTASGGVRSRIAQSVQTTDENLPAGVHYHEQSDNYVCESCEQRYNPTQQGLRRVCQCCDRSVRVVDRDSLRQIPLLDLKLSAAEITRSPLTEAQLRTLQAVYLAKRFAFDPVFQFDPLTDSMTTLLDDLGVEQGNIDELLSGTHNGQSLLTKQAETTPHTVYNITSTGRSFINESAKQGYDWGPGRGDLNESTLHRIGVVFLAAFLKERYADQPERNVNVYYELPNGKVVDVVVLDADREVVVAAEMECDNNDQSGEGSSPRSTYSKLAPLDLEEAVWVFETGDHWASATADLAAAHENPSSEIEFRESGYGRSYLSKDPSLEYPGMTEALTLSTLTEVSPYPRGLYDRDPTRFFESS